MCYGEQCITLEAHLLCVFVNGGDDAAEWADSARKAVAVQGIRVEVNGQVLSQGGNLGADRIMDTTSRMQTRQDPGFLPPAVIIGLQPLRPLQVPSLPFHLSKGGTGPTVQSSRLDPAESIRTMWHHGIISTMAPPIGK